MKTTKCKHCGYRLPVKEWQEDYCFSCETINEVVKAIMSSLVIYPNKRSVAKWADELKQILID